MFWVLLPLTILIPPLLGFWPASPVNFPPSGNVGVPAAVGDGIPKVSIFVPVGVNSSLQWPL